VTPIKGDDNELECFPWWSPDGKYVYYVSAHYEPTDSNLQKDFIVNYEKIKYNIYRRAYNEASETLEDAELIFNADSLGKSATLPRISPDGKYLMFTLGNYGVFHIWHKDADLYLMDLATRKVRCMNTLNSRDVESYHSWSSNGRWVVFSSRRYDGNFTRPYIAYIDADGKEYKPFELPQEDPEFHRLFMRSYNIPEFMSGPVEISAQDFARLIRGYEAEKATLRK
jgi:Tol biopolymer transport system component